MKRWQEQRWLLDAIVRVVGPEFDQGRLTYLTEPVGMDMAGDANLIRQRVKRFADFTSEFQRVGRSREQRASVAEKEGHFVTAAANYLAASLMYGGAMWPIWEDDDPLLLQLDASKNACYAKFIEYAPHHIEKVEIPFDGKTIPGLLHLPSKEKGGQYPCVVAIPGMDNFKETQVFLHGDKLLSRGLAVLSVDGPGQGESLTRNIKVTLDNSDRAGKSIMDFLLGRPEIDGKLIAIQGISMGSYWVPRMVAHDGRYKAASVTAICQEPGMRTLFNAQSPAFKMRYMWMAGIYDEDEFDAYASKLTLEGIAAKIKCPFLTTAGEDDPLCPVQYTYDFHKELAGPNQLTVYEGFGHYVPFEENYRADWMRDRIDQKPFESCILRVDSNRVTHRIG